MVPPLCAGAVVVKVAMAHTCSIVVQYGIDIITKNEGKEEEEVEKKAGAKINQKSSICVALSGCTNSCPTLKIPIYFSAG